VSIVASLCLNLAAIVAPRLRPLGQNIKALEKLLGTRLLYRTTRDRSLTEEAPDPSRRSG
jgi:hypothetical protein